MADLERKICINKSMEMKYNLTQKTGHTQTSRKNYLIMSKKFSSK